jgi:hypothetical protein
MFEIGHDLREDRNQKSPAAVRLMSTTQGLCRIGNGTLQQQLEILMFGGSWLH